MRIDWKLEVEKAERWADKKQCCSKYIDLAKQIADEAGSYAAMWEAEFELRKNFESKLRTANSRVMNKPFRPEQQDVLVRALEKIAGQYVTIANAVYVEPSVKIANEALSDVKGSLP